MADANVSVPGEVVPAWGSLASCRCAQILSSESLFNKGLCSFLSGGFRLLSEMDEFAHGRFKRSLFFLLCLIAFLGVFPVGFCCFLCFVFFLRNISPELTTSNLPLFAEEDWP